ncbi:hypothetical protein [Streptomyces sp. NBC_00448]|uniref:hypothetical protein n=1 Tax=Streptomyces sp. NBC_00448 TaxID=2903652 RepID=UPI002E1D6A32
MITQSDDGQDFDPDDPLTVILRPTPAPLGLPPGRYEKIRRGAARRRMLRIAVGVGLSGAVAALVVVPLRMTGPVEPAAPTVPLGPPPASSPSAGPTSSPVPSPATRPPTDVPTSGPPTAKTPRTQQVPSGANASATQAVPATPSTSEAPPAPDPTDASPRQSGNQPSPLPTELRR